MSHPEWWFFRSHIRARLADPRFRAKRQVALARMRLAMAGGSAILPGDRIGHE